MDNFLWGRKCIAFNGSEISADLFRTCAYRFLAALHHTPSVLMGRAGYDMFLKHTLQRVAVERVAHL